MALRKDLRFRSLERKRGYFTLARDKSKVIWAEINTQVAFMGKHIQKPGWEGFGKWVVLIISLDVNFVLNFWSKQYGLGLFI